MVKTEPNMICKITCSSSFFHIFILFQKSLKNPQIPKKGQNFQSRDKIPKSESTGQRWARTRTGSDWIRTEANFGRITTGSDCNFL